jgi:protein TonB
MKLDLFNNKWLDIVFEGRNKQYGAYEMRKNSTSTSLRALAIGAVVFSLAVATPKIAEFFGRNSDEDNASLDKKIVTIKLPPKEEKPKIPVPPPPPPPPKVDQVKFVKPVVAKKEEVVEEPPKIKEIVDKKIGDKDIKGDKDAVLTVEPPGDGPKKQEVVEDNNVYNSAGVEVQPEFPGGMGKFDEFIRRNLDLPDEELNGRIIVQFTVEKDGSLSNVQVLRDLGYGTDKAALKLFAKCPKWNPAVQNGKKVRCTYVKPIVIKQN